MRGADLVAQTLSNAGIRTIFALSGNQIMPIFDACIDADIRIVHVRHEAAAVYMADAWGQITGEVGVALVTAAPGFANAISSLYTARGSESPVVLLSGDSGVAQDGMGAFQELDQVAVAAPVTKASFRGRTAGGLGYDVARALRVARSGRPGPVHLALPFDLLNADVAADAVPPAAAAERELAPAPADAVEAMLAAFAKAARPIIVTGPALNRSRAGGLLAELETALGAPVVSLESPRGLRDPSLGAFAEVLADADAILSLGKSIDYTIGFVKAPAVSATCRAFAVDADEPALERARRAFGSRLVHAVLADPDLTARALIDAAPDADHAGAPDRAGWRADVAAAVAFRGGVTDGAGAADMPPWVLCEAVQRVLDDAEEPILIADGGEFGQWAQAFTNAPTRLINGTAGAIGGGLCYALAAKLARPEATVVLMMGDGTAGFHFAEFDTAVREKAPFLAVIGNDARWNAEYMIQLRDYGSDRMIGCELGDARYDLAAAGFGCHGEHVTHAQGLAAALGRAAASGLPACLNVVIAPQAAPTFARTGKAAAGVH